MTEKKIQAEAIKYAKSLGCLVKRNVMRQGAEAGWPDTEIFGPTGKMMLLELKATGKEPTKLQARRIKELRERGHDARWTDDLNEAKRFIDDVC